MNTLIIEDEPAASKRLLRIIDECAPELHIITVLDSVNAVIKFLSQNPEPDLIITDVHLSDGPCFDIFKSAKVGCPVIFTTAYDQYAIEAFKLNSIDYLLKPINKNEFANSVEKLRQLNKSEKENEILYNRLSQLFNQQNKAYQKRIVVKFGQNIKAVDVDHIAYFFTEDKMIFLVPFDGHKLPVDQNLEELESILDPQKFFRINRQFIINFKAISNMIAYSKSRVKLVLNPPCHVDSIVSTERSPVFKEWLKGTTT